MKTALLIMIAVTMIQHLGLSEAIVKVVGKIASCPTCLTFWSCIVTLVVVGTDVIDAVVLSIVMAYASNWFVLLLIWLQRIFTWIMEYGKEDYSGFESTQSTEQRDEECNSIEDGEAESDT